LGNPVEHRTLGNSNIKVSLVGIGCNNFGGRIPEADAREVVSAAIDAGITLFDTSDNYGNRGGSERFLGEVLGARRKDIVLASKFGMQMDDAGTMMGASRRYIMSAVEASLKRLKTDWLDLYQLHQPDPKTPIEETLRAMDDLLRQGKVRSIGCSNLSAAQVTEALNTSKTAGMSAFVTCQDEYSLLVRGIERELLPTMEKNGLSLLPFYPLASGLLSGKYQRDVPIPARSRLTRVPVFTQRFLNDRNWSIAMTLQDFAKQRGHTALELAFSWLAGRPTVASVIAGASTAQQVRENVAAAGWTLTSADLAEVDRITGAR
jgi:aryl-alcohol dehydrogenase-like predicted oxidoreductase